MVRKLAPSLPRQVSLDLEINGLIHSLFFVELRKPWSVVVVNREVILYLRNFNPNRFSHLGDIGG